MTVQTSTNVASFNGDGANKVFPIGYKFNSAADLVVLLVDDVAVTTQILTLNSDFTVTGAGDEEGGAVTLEVAPTANQRLTIIRIVDILQLTDLRNQGKFYAEIHEDAFDLLTMIAQQHQSDIALSLRVAETDPEPARIPSVAQRAGKLLAFDADGNPTTALPVADSSTELRQELAGEGGAAMVGGAGQVVGSIASLRDLLKTSPSKSAFVTGYYAQGDGGGGAYYLDASDTTSADNGGAVIVATDGGRWKLVHSGGVSVRAFGAKGDDVANDAAAIQAATVYCSAKSIAVWFPAGTYRLGSHVQIFSNTSWVANGDAKIHIPADCDLTGAANYGGAPRAIHNAAGISGVSLEGIDFYSDGTLGTYGTYAPTIAALEITGLTVKGCKFRKFGDSTHYAQGLVSFGCSNVLIESSEFLDCSGDGAACAEGGSNVRFLANTASGNGDWGFALSNGVVGAQVIGNTFEYNVSTATGADECSEVSFIGNRSKGNEHGIRIAKFVGTFVGDQYDVIISGNVSVADQFGISVESAQYFSVSGNNIRAASAQGIRISASSEGTVSGNSVVGSGAESILLSEGAAGVTVAANTTKFGTYGIRQVDSAPSPHLIAADNQISAASVAPVAGITYKADSLHLGPDGKPYFSGAPSINSGVVAATATGGGVVPPANVWGYIPIQVGTETKLIPVYNP